MIIKTEQASPGARGIDTVLQLSQVMCTSLKNTGIDFAVRYLNGLTPAEVQTILQSGLALLAVTYADQFDGVQAAAKATSLGLPKGMTLFLDVESVGVMLPAVLIARINQWAHDVRGAGYDPGMYVGCNALLTSAELMGLSVDRYWKACSRIWDRNGQVAEPSCGWCLVQILPGNTKWAGILVDIDFCGTDYLGRSAVWAKGIP